MPIDAFGNQTQADPLDEWMASQDAARRSVMLNQAPPPDMVGRANELSRKSGLPPTIIEQNIPAYEAQDRASRVNELVRQYPAIGRWGDNPRNLALAQDDLESVRRNAEYWTRVGKASGNLQAAQAPAPTIWNSLKGIGANLLYGFQATPDDIRDLAEGLLTSDAEQARKDALTRDFGEVATRSMGRMQAARRYQAAQDSNPAFRSRLWRNVYGAASSLAQLAAPVVAGVVTGGVGAGLTLTGVTVGAPAYQKYRQRGASRTQAVIGGTLEGGMEAAGEKLTLGFLNRALGKVGFGKFITGFVARELPGELATTIGQNAVDTAIANPDVSWADYVNALPSDLLDTGIQTLMLGGAVAGLNHAGMKAAQRFKGVPQALDDASDLGGGMDAAVDAKTRQRDPEAFKALIESLAGGESPNLYIPAEAVQQYLQAADYDPAEAGFWGQYADQMASAAVANGDIVIPVSDFAAKMAGSKAWEALKHDARLSPGGISFREAQEVQDSYESYMEEIGGQVADDMAAQQRVQAPREALMAGLTDKLQNAGFTPATARTNAAILTQRAATRASRMGTELTGTEFDALDVNQVLPERIAAAQKADQLDIVINAMRDGGRKGVSKGKSLTEWIRAQGGIEDRGGDLASMGVGPIKGVSRKGQMKLLRDYAPGQASMMDDDGQQNSNSLDNMALRAWEAGYLPEFTERPSPGDLVDAIGDAIAGRDRYADGHLNTQADAVQESVTAAADDLRAMLDAMGFDTDSASPREIRAAVAQYADQAAQGVGYDQSLSGGPRGRITFPAAGYGTGKTIIDLFQSRNNSTFIHEAGHMWLEELRADALDGASTDQVRSDWQKVQDWFSANGHPLGEYGAIPVDAHELWARTAERYFMEGKATSPALRSIFETLKSWMVQVYRMVSRLNAPITDDIREVMDRLIATDEEIAAASEEQKLEATFTEKPASMSDAEWDGYQGLVKASRDDAHDTLLAKTMAAIKRRVTKEYHDREASVRDEVAAEVSSQPEFRAYAAAKAAPLNIDWIKERYGADAAGLMPAFTTKNGGANPDDLSEMSGFASGDEMVRALMGLESHRRELKEGGDTRSVREGLIQDEAKARMFALYGDPFTDGSIEEEALASVHNEKQGDLMAADLRILGRSVRKKPTPYSVAKAWAARAIAEGKVNDMTSRSAIERYRRAARKAGDAATKAHLAGDANEAFRQKQAQMLNNALIVEAQRQSEAIDKAVTRLSRWAKARTVKSVDQAYLERAQGLLEQVDMRNHSQRNIERQTSFEEWAQEHAANGYDIVVPPSFSASLGTTHWSRLTVEQLLGLDAAVDQIIHLGRHKQTMLDNKERRDFEAVRDEALGQMGGMDRKPPSTFAEPGYWDTISNGIASADAALLKMETVFDWLDNGDPNGVFNRIVFRPLADAQHNEQAMLREYVVKVQELTRALPKEVVARWRDKFSDHRLASAKAENIMTRDQLVSVALNMGNEGNRAKLMGGYGWNANDVMDVLNENLTADEWAYVQAIWDTIDSLWPQIEALEKRVNGIAPEKVDAVPIQTAHGVLRGGYYPVVYDPRFSIEAEANAAKSNNLFENIYQRARTSMGFTKERTDVERPIHLSIGIIELHLSEVIHDVTHREAVMQADRFLSDKRIMQAVDETFGKEVRRQFRPWLQHIANEWAYDRAGMGALEKFMRTLRRRSGHLR